MFATMSKVRAVLQLEEDNREALRLESALTRKDMGEIVDDLIREHLSEALSQIRERRAARDRAKKDKK